MDVVMEPATLLFAIIATMLAAFVFGPWRYDLVAGVALLSAVYLGVVPGEAAFDGLSHPAVVTVAAVLVIAKALQNCGVVDLVARWLSGAGSGVGRQVAVTGGVTAALSAVMNNVGALALMLPVALRNAKAAGAPASLLLMPLAFASMLGGLITLIGTPPNLVVSGFRQAYVGEPFDLFDFSPVGLVVAAAGLVYLALIGWRLLPRRSPLEEEDDLRAKLAPFVVEMRVPSGSPFDGRSVRDIETMCENEITIMTIIRDGGRWDAPGPRMRLMARDVLVIEGDPSVWGPLADGERLTPPLAEAQKEAAPRPSEIGLFEAIVLPNAFVEGRSVRGIRMHDTYGVNLLGLSRHGEPLRSRLRNVRFRAGDLLLVQGDQKTLRRVLAGLGCLTLSQRDVVERKASPLSVGVGVGVFAAALAVAALEIVSAPLALVSAAAGYVAINAISLREAYDSVDWPILMLLSALIPIGYAMESTGAAGMVADGVAEAAGGAPDWFVVGLVILVSMWLSDLIHNTPTAVLMSPVAAGIATSLEMSVDPLLIAVAVGAASAYLTPVGHQSNTLVMGPGGYRFFDYARVGFGLQIVILLTATPTILWVWPPS